MIKKLSRLLTYLSYIALGGALAAWMVGPIQFAYALALISVVAMMASSLLIFSTRLIGISKEVFSSGQQSQEAVKENPEGESTPR